MKTNFILLGFLLLWSSNSYAQEDTGNKGIENILSVKAGFMGAWLGYEKSITKTFSVNTEVGYEGGLTGGSGDIDFILTSSLSLEPKFYYNYFNRLKKGKKVNNNSANHLSVELIYIPDFLTTTDKDNIEVMETFSIVPKWGMRRSISQKLFFDFAVGAGYYWGENDNNGTAAALDLRVGYTL